MLAAPAQGAAGVNNALLARARCWCTVVAGLTLPKARTRARRQIERTEMFVLAAGLRRCTGGWSPSRDRAPAAVNTHSRILTVCSSCARQHTNASHCCRAAHGCARCRTCMPPPSPTAAPMPMGCIMQEIYIGFFADIHTQAAFRAPMLSVSHLSGPRQPIAALRG